MSLTLNDARVRANAGPELPLVLWPDPVLLRPAEPVILPDELVNAQAVFWHLARAVKKYRAQGMAAPQLGFGFRVLAIASGMTRHMMGMVNPSVTPVGSETLTGEEGCLSLPGRWFWVPRAAVVDVAWTAPNGDARQDRFVGHRAAVVQHEIDHLNGRLICDHGEEIR